MKLMGIRLSLIWLVMAMAATAQIIPPPPFPVLDTTRQPLRRVLEYYINPALLDALSGPLTLVENNITSARCPPYVGEGQPSSKRLPVTFAPLEDNENVVMVGKNFKATLSKPKGCEGSTHGRSERQIRRLKRALIPADRERLMSLGNDDNPVAVQFERVLLN
nr:kunitz type trypsin inhibitor 111-like [Ziziphus jujuba var. spinosa]